MSSLCCQLAVSRKETARNVSSHRSVSCRYEEYVPAKKRRALQQQARLNVLSKVLLTEARAKCIYSCILSTISQA